MGTTEPLAESGIEQSVGSVGDAFDNALAESIIGRYKTEVIGREAEAVYHRQREHTASAA